MEYEAIIGLEVHIELKTKSKMFCGCDAEHFGVSPNTHACPVCLGLPGALPVPNKKAVEWTILLGLALNCKINEDSKFDRKHYFYPDLPKGYQITQYDEPLCEKGQLVIARSIATKQSHEIAALPPVARNDKIVRIRRVHLEEDTGKLLHANQIPNYDGPPDVSLVDFNRSGVPLVEIVTEPDFRSAEEAKEFLKKIQLIVRYLGISDADMEKGSMRIEPSISLRRLPESALRARSDSGSLETELPNYRVEVKNINSFRFAQKAIDYEIARQKEVLESGGKIEQETRGWNDTKNQTIGQRSKEEAHDYRYFTEPDIPPMRFKQLTIDNLQLTMPELPDGKTERYVSQWKLKSPDAEVIVAAPFMAKYFEAAVELGEPKGIEPQKIANLIINKKVDIYNQTPVQLIISITQKDRAAALSFDELTAVCQKIIDDNQKVVTEIKSGKSSAFQFLLGQVMKEAHGRSELDSIFKVFATLGITKP